MSTQTTSPVSAAAVAASVELYREMALRWERAREVPVSGNPMDILGEHRAVTHEEAQAAADGRTEKFRAILAERARQGFEDAYLLLGCDLILCI